MGILLISTPMDVVKELMGQLKRLLTPPPSREDYRDLLVMLYQLFRVVQSTGVMALEPHFDNPAAEPDPVEVSRSSSSARRRWRFWPTRSRVIIVGGISAHDFEHLMYEDLEVRQRDGDACRRRRCMKVGDALPGLGIVAAVLGVVITMQAIDGPPSEIGHKVGAALVGTFLGILLSYGFVAAGRDDHGTSRDEELEHRAVHQGRDSGDPQGICAGDRRRVRAAGHSRRSPALVRRDREAVPQRAE